MSFITDLVEGVSDVPAPEEFRTIAANAREAEGRYFREKDERGAEEACAAWEAIIAHPNFALASVPFRIAALIRCGIVYFLSHSAERQELDRACWCWERAVEIAPAGFAHLDALFSLIAAIYKDKYTTSLSLLDLDRAIAAYDLAISHAGTRVQQLPMILGHFGITLFQKYECSDDITHLNRAVAVTQQAIALTNGSASDADHLHWLATYLGERYSCTRNEGDLDAEVDALERCLNSTPEDASALITRFGNLGVALVRRHTLKGVSADINRAIDVLQRATAAAKLDSLELPLILSNLSSAFHSLYESSSDINDLERSIVTAERGISLVSEQSPYLPLLLNTLALGLQHRWESQGNSKDLDRAIDSLARSIDLTPPGSRGLALRLHNMGLMHLDNYDRAGNADNLETAIALLQSAVERTSEQSQDLPGHLRVLARAKRVRYQRTGEVTDLESAIDLYRRALDLTPTESSDRAASLSSMGIACEELYQHTAESEDLEQALQLFRQALEIVRPDSPDKFTLLHCLARARIRCYQKKKDVGDLDDAIHTLEAALNRTPSRRLANELNTLGVALSERYGLTHDGSDLEKASGCLEQAVTATSTDSPKIPMYLNNLANVLRDRYSRTRDQVDLTRALEMYRNACVLGLESNPREAIGAAHNWGDWAAERAIARETTVDEVAEAYVHGVNAIQQLFRRQLTLEGKKTWLKENKLFPSRAAVALADAGHVQEAAVILEESRALLLSETLQRDRADLERLQDRGRSDLADRFRRAADRLNSLEQAQRSDDWPVAKKGSTVVELLQSARADLESVVSAIRNEPGYETFLQPPNFAEIQAASVNHPLAYLTASPWGGLALVVWPEKYAPPLHPFWQGVTPVWLPDLSESWVAYMLWVGRLFRAKGEGAPVGYMLQHSLWHYDRGSARARKQWVEALDDTTRWLWEAAMGPLIHFLLACGERSVVLIPQGLLSLLPLHAAWTEDDTAATGRKYALDELTITYAPNARALTSARKTTQSSLPPSFLGIANPLPSTLESLPHAYGEVQVVASYFRESCLLCGEEALRDRVVSELPRYSVLHFACHGEADLLQPLNSQLFLAHDHAVTLRQFLAMRLNARLAVLSACETGVTDFGLPDEAMGLPTGLLLAGVGGVLLSLWPVDDMVTMMLVARFYDFWQRGGSEPAEALQMAQRWVRDASNQEKSQYIVSALNDKLGLPQETIALLAGRESSGLVSWGAFTYTGA
ncbi:MAG: CHAT domain-containing protein [Terriglobales bacterium]